MDELTRAVDRWAADRLDARRIDRGGPLSAALRAELGQMGLFGLTLPPAHGGSGLSLGEACAVVRVLARHDRSVATTVGLHAGLGTRGLIRYGTAAQRDRWLPELATGARIAAFCATEAGAGSDLEAIRATAHPEAGGLRVEGEKIFVTNGGFAGLYTLVVRTPGRGGLRATGLVVVCPEDPGFSRGTEEQKLGLRGSSTTSIHCAGVRLPADRLLGEPGEGPRQLAHVLAWGRTLMAAGCLGTADAALEAARRHTAARRQFGRPLDAQEVVRRQLAELAALRFGLGALVRRAAASPDDPTLIRRSTIAKIACSEGAQRVVDTALQLHGGSGFIEPTGLPLLFRDVRITRIFEGANDVLCTHLGAMELARPDDGEQGPAAALRASLRARHGVRVLSRKADLHRLGHLVVLDALHRAAREAATTPAERALAAHLGHWVRARVPRWTAEGPDPAAPIPEVAA